MNRSVLRKLSSVSKHSTVVSGGENCSTEQGDKLELRYRGLKRHK